MGKYDKDIAEIWEKAREAIDFRRQSQDEVWRELDSFDRGEQWNIKGPMPTWIPKPSSNYISKIKRFKTGNLSLDNYTGELKPLAPEDEPQIWALQKFYEQLWDKLNMKRNVLDVVRTSRLLGSGIMYIGWDETYIGGTRNHLYQGEIVVREVEPSTFFVDPKAFSLDDALYCGTFVRTTKEHILADPGIDKDKKKDFIENRNYYANSMGGQSDRGEIYNDRDYSSYQEDVVDLITYYKKKPLDEGGYEICVYHIADGVLVKYTEALKPNRFPFIKLDQHPIRQSFWGMSDARLVLPNVKMINKVQSIIGTIATLYQNPQKIVYEGSGIDPRIVSKYGNAFGLVFLSKYPDLANAMRNVPVQDIPRELLNYIEFLKNDIEDFSGISQFNTGQSSGSIQTASGISSMIERSLVSEYDEMATFEGFLEDVTYLLLSNAVTYYVDDRSIRMSSTDSGTSFEYEYMPFMASEFADLMWDFQIDIVQKIKDSDQNRKETMKMLSEWQLQYSPEVQLVTPADIVKAFNPYNRDLILDRIEKETETKKQETAQAIVDMVTQAIDSGELPQNVVGQVLEILKQNGTNNQQKLGDVQKRQQGL